MAFRPLPQVNDSQNLYPGFLKNYGFGSTTVFITILVMATCVGQWTHPYSEALSWCIARWDLVIYIFSILQGMERQASAWNRQRLTRGMTPSQYADFQREEYLAEHNYNAGYGAEQRTPISKLPVLFLAVTPIFLGLAVIDWGTGYLVSRLGMPVFQSGLLLIALLILPFFLIRPALRFLLRTPFGLTMKYWYHRIR